MILEARHFSDVRFTELNQDNLEFKRIAANMLFEVNKEKEIDPRL